MKGIQIEKIVLSMGSTEKNEVENGKKILKSLTGMNPKIMYSNKRNLFGGKPGDPMGCMVTVRNNDDLLKRLLKAKDNKLSTSNFDDTGNFNFGIDEYINIPGMDYDPQIGILGLNVAVRLERKGYSIKRKKISRKIGTKHKISKQEAMGFVKTKFGAEIKGDPDA